MDDLIVSQVTASAIVVYLIEWLKRSPLAPWVTTESRTLARTLSAVGAAVSSFGVHLALAGDASSGWSITIAIPSAAVLLHALWDWLSQLALNQLVYQGVVEPPKATQP